MARPVEFDHETVLNNAMEQFWKDGYEASSVQKLLDCTGINRGTLYNSFGDKDTFFRACVAQYNAGLGRQMAASLENPDLGPWEAIEKFLELTVVGAPARQRSLGCLLVNSLCESINHDKEMKKLLRDSLAAIRKPLMARVKEAEAKGKLRKDLSVDLATDALMNGLHGLRVSAREGRSPKQLADLVTFLLDSLRRK